MASSAEINAINPGHNGVNLYRRTSSQLENRVAQVVRFSPGTSGGWGVRRSRKCVPSRKTFVLVLQPEAPPEMPAAAVA
jgi:hypothetical protein